MELVVEDKVIVITGSTSGLGKELALNMARLGACVVINYSYDEERALETFQEICCISERVLLCRADVANEIQVREMYRNVKKNLVKLMF